jgi:parvulin-like peptidyl-prolyl isomerase
MITEKVNTVMNLDKDEQELLDSIKNDNWVSIPDSKLEIQRFQEIAKHQISMQKIELQVSLQDSDTI